MNDLVEVESYLATLIPRSRSFGDRLEHTKALLRRLGNPQNNIPAVHIAGTSGKGSTAYYVASLLKEAGYSVGLSVSPHVSKVSERAQINGTPLADSEYCRYFTEFKDCIESFGETITYIEFLTCFSFWLFAKLKLDYMVIEVGLGGRLDATNTITRENTVRVITDIGLDHTEILGDTLDVIAAEKAGIIHDGDTICMHPQGELVMKSVLSAVRAHSARLVLVENDDVFEYEPRGFQLRNWRLARVAVAERLAIDNKLPLTKEQVQSAVQMTIPGRFEVFESENETIILDAAHNPQKITALMKALRETYPSQTIFAVVAFGKNKQATVQESLRIISEAVQKIIFTEFTVEGDENHQAIVFPESIKNPHEALKQARAYAQGATVVVTGSFYLISNVRDALMKEFGKAR